MTLKTDMAADLTAVFFNTDEFAETVTLTPYAASARLVTIGYEAEDLASQNPQPPGDEMIILVPYTALAAPAKGDVYTIAGVSWNHKRNVSGGRAEDIWHIEVTRSARRNIG